MSEKKYKSTFVILSTLFLLTTYLSANLPAASSDKEITFFLYDPEWPFPKDTNADSFADFYKYRDELLDKVCKNLGSKLNKKFKAKYIQEEDELFNLIGKPQTIGFINSKFFMENLEEEIIPIFLPQINGSVYQKKCLLSLNQTEVYSCKIFEKKLAYYQMDGKILQRQIKYLVGNKTQNPLIQIPTKHMFPNPESAIISLLYGMADYAFVPEKYYIQLGDYIKSARLYQHSSKEILTYSPLVVTDPSADFEKSMRADIRRIAKDHLDIFGTIGIKSLEETNKEDFVSRNFIFYKRFDNLTIEITPTCTPSANNTNAMLHIYIRLSGARSEKVKKWPFHYDAQINNRPMGIVRQKRRNGPIPQYDALLSGEITLQNSQQSARTYQVKHGDNLSRIAKKELGDKALRTFLFELNKSTLDGPDILKINQKIKIPQATYNLFLKSKRFKDIHVLESNQLFTDEPITINLNKFDWRIK
jgi:hypothetical protein